MFSVYFVNILETLPSLCPLLLLCRILLFITTTWPLRQSVDNSHGGVLYPIVLISIFNPTSHTRVPLGLRWCHRFMTLLPTQWHTYCVVQNTINLSCFLINCQPQPPPLVSCHVTWHQTSTWESRFCLFIKMSPESGPGLNFSACFIFPVLQRFE